MSVPLRVRISVFIFAVCSVGLAGCDDLPTPVVPTPIQPAAQKPKAVVTGALDVSQSGEPGQIAYDFALKLTESGGVHANITALWINFDNGFGGSCSWKPADLRQSRLLANSTLAIETLTCDDFHDQAFNVTVYVNITDDNGYQTNVTITRDKL